MRSSTSRLNELSMRNGFKAFRQLKNKHILSILLDVADVLVRDALQNKGYEGFTGNTQTSYSVGIYQQGELKYIVSSQDGQRRPVREKLKKGEVATLRNPYEGTGPKTRIGQVSTDGLSGEASARKFLASYKPTRNGFAMVMTTGTEYSEWLETKHNLNVLTSTAKDFKNIFLSNMRMIL